ncbi:MAG: hypothetical protein WD605_02900 [Candidatus Paceibacterota bacterium]
MEERKSLKETAREILAFYEDAIDKNVAEEVTEYGPYSPRLWHFIFLHFFHCGPVDPKDNPAKEGQPLGSNDPKWDTLLVHNKALKAQRLVLRLQKARANALVRKQSERKAA